MSEYSQYSFIGGMNLQVDDTRLTDSQYRCGINMRNRYDVPTVISDSQKDESLPAGIKQEMVTFGNYIIAFVNGSCYYRYYTDFNWTQLVSFSMSPTAPRYWTCAVPVTETNYLRIASNSTVTGATTVSDAGGGIQLLTLEGAAAGNLPGLLVQDNTNQPVFIFIDNTGVVQSRVTQAYGDWRIGFTDGTNIIVGPNGGTNDPSYDLREYVPIGNCMCYSPDGILYVVDPTFTYIFRSVSGRPLDFVVNVTNLLVNGATTIDGMTSNWQLPGGPASTTAYTVGVGGISCIRNLNTGGIFVSASNANFAVTLNKTPGAQTLFGEYTFIRTFLFNATNLSDRTIIDSLGDTRFIDLVGIRSFNAIETLQNEGRNSVFSSGIQKALQKKVNGKLENIVQDAQYSAAILFDNYELYALNTALGNVIAVYDTINSCWSSFDTTQTGGKRIKAFAKIELTVQALYAITEDDQLYVLYSGTTNAIPYLRTNAVNYSVRSQYTGQTVRLNDPKAAIKLTSIRFTMTEIEEDCNFSATIFVDDRQSRIGTLTRNINYVPPSKPYTGPVQLPDTDSMLYNGMFSSLNCENGWDVFLILSWSAGSLIQYSLFMEDLTPMNPVKAQSNAAANEPTVVQ